MFVSMYIEHLYLGDSLNLACDTLAGVRFLRPPSIERLKRAWKLCAIWRKVEPPARACPFTSLVVGVGRSRVGLAMDRSGSPFARRL